MSRKEARNGKPFFELNLADAEAKLVLRVFNDDLAFVHCEGLQAGMFIEIRGEFSQSPNFGLETRNWSCRSLSEEERALLLSGSAELKARQDGDYREIEGLAGSLSDPRLKALALLFLADYGERFRRTAAARQNHHARRGGLVEHVAQMMRSADALCKVYTHLHRDLVLTGVLFHDCGKLWENALPPDGFVMPFEELGELLGHIPIGIELVNALWRKLMGSEEAKLWSSLRPANDDVRLHLLHLVASHHGELQFGSPVVPKTAEAWALHYVDNLDAKMEMMAASGEGRLLAPRIRERMWPLPGNTVASLGSKAVQSEMESSS